MDVYVPAVGTKVLLKVENAGDRTINKEVKLIVLWPILGKNSHSILVI